MEKLNIEYLVRALAQYEVKVYREEEEMEDSDSWPVFLYNEFMTIPRRPYSNPKYPEYYDDFKSLKEDIEDLNGFLQACKKGREEGSTYAFERHIRILLHNEGLCGNPDYTLLDVERFLCYWFELADDVNHEILNILREAGLSEKSIKEITESFW